jgi:hypothetical protein
MRHNALQVTEMKTMQLSQGKAILPDDDRQGNSLSVGVTDLKVDGQEPTGTIIDLEVGGIDSRGTMLNPNLFKGY